MYHKREPNLIKLVLPEWAKPRGSEWKYAGCERRKSVSFPKISFEERMRYALRSDHGEIREADYYPKGATLWYKEAKNDI